MSKPRLVRAVTAATPPGSEGTLMRRTGDWARRAPLLPALVFMIIVTQLPFVVTLIISFMNWNAYYPDERGFAGIDNYRRVLTDANTRQAIWVTILLTVGVVLISLVLGLRDRAAAGPEVPRPRGRPDDDDHPVPDRAGGRRTAVEARALQPGVRPLQRRADLDLRRERAAAGLDQQPAAVVDHLRAGLAVDAVHDADPAGRAAEPPARRDRGGRDRRREPAGTSSGT